MTARGGRRRGVQRVEMLDAPEPDQALWLKEPAPSADGPQLIAPSDSRRRGRIALAAVGGVVAILVVANVLSDTGDERRATPPTSTVLPSTTARPTTTGATTESDASTSDAGSSAGTPSRLVPRAVVVDVPPGYVVQDAERFDTGPDATAGQLWATWSSDPAAATWAWISMYPTGSDWPSSGTSRIWLRNGVGLLSTNPDGTLRLETNRPGEKVMVVAHGLGPQALAAIVDSLQVSGNHFLGVGAMDSIGLRLVASTDDDDPVADSVSASFIGISSTGDPPSWISVRVGQPMRTFDRALRSFLLRDAQAITVGGSHLATVGIDGRTLGNDDLVAIVDVDGTEVEVTGQVSRDDIVDVAGALRMGTDADWDELAASVEQPDLSGTTSTDLAIGSGKMRSGDIWAASLSIQAGAPALVSASVTPTGSVSGGSVFGGRLGDSMGIQPLATESGVVLVAGAGREYQGAELRVAVADASYHGSLTDPGPEAPGVFGSVGFSELAPYHAELVAPDGTVLATLDGT